jgi:hypothetical protein
VSNELIGETSARWSEPPTHTDRLTALRLALGARPARASACDRGSAGGLPTWPLKAGEHPAAHRRVLGATPSVSLEEGLDYVGSNVGSLAGRHPVRSGQQSGDRNGTENPATLWAANPHAYPPTSISLCFARATSVASVGNDGHSKGLLREAAGRPYAAW